MSGGKISLLSWNVNGLRAVLMKGALGSFVEKYDPDVLLLQEVKISRRQIRECGVEADFNAYAQFFTPAGRSGYAGTGVWVKKSLDFLGEKKVHRHFEGLVDGYGDVLDEGRLTVVELADFYVVSVYVPNAKDDLSRLELRGRWDEYLAEVILELQKEKPVVVAGDFNVAHQPMDLARPKPNEGRHGYTVEERRGFGELLMRADLVDSFRELYPTRVKYSWWSHWGKARANNVGWRIDYVLVSRSLMSRLAGAEIYTEVLGSDHCPVGVEVLG